MSRSRREEINEKRVRDIGAVCGEHFDDYLVVVKTGNGEYSGLIVKGSNREFALEAAYDILMDNKRAL